ncbi:MAG: PadR family transcriptional regulator [Chloroflexi bacterium]|nr:PadR family transcriptional regulator [Chloroflexota bacterium]
MGRDDDNRRRHRGRGRRRRDFWHAWREERRRRWHEYMGENWSEGGPPGEPSPEMIQAWREFFHHFAGTWPEEHWAIGGRRFSPWHQGMDVFNPFVAMLLSKGGGLLPLIVMQYLAKQPRYGNEIMSLLTDQTGGQWIANPGAIYPLMTDLEKQGLISGEWEDPQKRTVRVYHLTEAGQQELARLQAIVRPKLISAIEVLNQFVDELDTEPDSDESDDLMGFV